MYSSAVWWAGPRALVAFLVDRMSPYAIRSREPQEALRGGCLGQMSALVLYTRALRVKGVDAGW